MTAEPGGTALTRFVSDQGRARGRRRAAVLRWTAAGLAVLAVLVAAAWVVVGATGAGSPGLVGWVVGLPASVLCPTLAAVAVYATARVARREATERIWLAGSVLVADDEVAGRRDYDLATSPVEFRLRSLLTKVGPRPVWAELHIGADPAERLVLPLTDRDTRRARPADELYALAAALDRSTQPAARLAAGRLRTLARWGGLAPLRGTDTDDIPLTPGGDTGPAPM